MPTRPEDAQDARSRVPTAADAEPETHPDATRGLDQDQDHSGYAERAPGRGDHAGRAAGERVDRHSPAEQEASDRSRWRTDDRDGRSERWSGNEGPDKNDAGD
ncbi:hypothetical protein WCE41_01845 [Luteimonas sp. MJ246]|uniref:hypothetical protein n=1 Tax=Luteimonas sp. MJ174 TaxID=3129237 RepID=UPI0031BBABAD